MNPIWAEKTAATEAGWNFDNSYARLPKTLFSEQNPTPVSSPRLTVFNDSLAATLGLNAQALRSGNGVEILAGNRIPEGALPLAQAYAGHQYGKFNMLGDGRALLLSEQLTPQGKRLDVQLKGPGRSPYSRKGDGRASIGPMLREYIMSEAMHALGIATTRSLAVVATGETRVKDDVEQDGAVLTRIAASHIRIATFQYAAKWGTHEELRALSDYTLQRLFPEAQVGENRFLTLLQEVVRRQAVLIAQWQLIGFVHGVLNTDNVAISGETIDYGPCAFMNAYDPTTVFSSIDPNGRYAYGEQPDITVWNLTQLADALLPILHDDKVQAVQLARDAVSEFTRLYERNWLEGMRAKLGIFNEEPEDEDLIQELLSFMYKHHADYTNTFLALTFEKLEETALFHIPEFLQWHERWRARLDRQQESEASSKELMRNNNPAIIPRNHRVEEALEAAVKQGDYTVMERLLAVIARPFAHTPEQSEYAAPPEPSACSYKTFCGT
ncbi:MAG: hypothetical protein K0R57_5811 [Paenibacillaceae bacterium]|nr:hypothetical protein [Paenibacillaceae bacterium]